MGHEYDINSRVRPQVSKLLPTERRTKSSTKQSRHLSLIKVEHITFPPERFIWTEENL